MARILLVDDDDLIRDMLRLTLMRFGYEVIDVADGSEAVRQYQSQKADLVITDILMPGKEGLETITEIRRIDPAARIIAISGGGRNAPTLYLQLAQRLGATCALAKPFTHDELLDAISAALAPMPGSETSRPQVPDSSSATPGTARGAPTQTP